MSSEDDMILILKIYGGDGTSTGQMKQTDTIIFVNTRHKARNVGSKNFKKAVKN